MLREDYSEIEKKENYQRVLDSGMFWVWYPKLSGDWVLDLPIINPKNGDVLSLMFKEISENTVIHELKIKQEYAELYYEGKKDWELRKNDKDFKVNDRVL